MTPKQTVLFNMTQQSDYC